jgi:hypothetical protein
MTLSPAERAEISRQNGKKSQGPKSAQGKSRSKFNALKHGLKAKLPVLPGEDPQQYQGLLDAWIANLQPSNDVEHSLVERAVTITWQLDRAERAETARLSRIIREAPAEAARRREEEAAALGQRLFFDRRGPLPLYPHSLYNLPDRPRVSFSGLSDDPDDPPRLLPRLEATAEGCRWLLDRWADLRGLLDRGLSWQSPDKLKAIRMLGRQPLDAADSEVVATIFQACHVLDPQTHHQAGVAQGEVATLAEALGTLGTLGPGVFARLRDEPGSHAASQPEPEPDESDDGEMDEGDQAEARIAWRRCGPAFAELLGELTKEEARVYRHRLEGRRVDRPRPQDPAAAKATLLAIVEQATARLAAKLEVHQAHAALAAAEAVDRLCFDESPEGERLRRFHLASQRALHRTVDSLHKLRRQEPPQPSGGEPAEPTGTGATGAGLSATICCGPDGIHSSFAADLWPAAPALPAGPPVAPDPEPDVQNPTNEPSAAAADPPSAPAEPTAPLGEHTNSPNEPDPSPPATPHSQAAIVEREISPNEPTASAGGHPHVSEEPAPSADDRGPEQEPAGGRRSARTTQDNAPGRKNPSSPAAGGEETRRLTPESLPVSDQGRPGTRKSAT